MQEWSKYWGYKIASKAVQEASIEKIWNTKDCLKEIIKYSSKVFTDPFMNKSDTGVPPVIYAASIHNRIVAMKKHRIFDRFGFNLQKADNIIVNTSTINQYDELVFDDTFNWVDEETEKPLTEYKPNPRLIAILENNINTDIE